MVLDNVYQFLMDKFGRIVIVRGETNSFEVVEPNDEKSGKIRLGRLFYANVVEGKIKGSDDDANKILTQGVVANRNGASASNCVEEIFRIMLIDDMKLEIRYLEDVITNSIIMGIICEDLQRIAPSRKDLFEEEKRDVLNNHREIFDYKYELYRKAFISYINGLNKDNDWNISDKLAFGEVINSSIVECLIGLQYNKKEQTGDRNGVKRATLEKLKKMKEDLERLKNYQNIGVNKDNLDEYYVRLWQKFHMESITRDGDGSKVPLINVMVLPDIREDVSEKNLVKPFGGNVRVQYVRANSGMGKSCMLRSIIVVCIAGYIYNNHMDLMSEDEIKAYEDNKFSAIEEFYFGEMKKNRVPVYIEAAKFNEYVDNDKKFFLGEDLFSLSENYSELRTAFNSIPDEFLFLIDSLDEIEERKVSNFNQCLYNLVGQMCEKNQFIITSRFSGRNIHINEMQYLRLGGFDTEAIHSYLEKCVFLERSEELKSYIDKNVYAYELTQNPFMLTAMLDTKSTFAVKNFLDKITDAIVTRRMNQKVLAMNEHEIKAVLSYLAFYISFCEEGEIIALEKIHISNIIKQARENGLISVSGYSINISDEQIDTFTNTISCQSGIITLINENGRIKFEFQDELVMCYLAAEYINNLSSMVEGDIPAEFYFNIENGNSAITHNVYEISRFWDNFKIDDNICSKRFCQIANLIIQITAKKSYGIALIYYMLLRGFTTIEEEALANIKTFFIEYNENVYGDNIPFNRKNELMKVTALIDRLFSISR